LLGIGVIAALVIGWQIAAFAGPVGSAQGFEDDDGNLADDAAVPGIDWNSFADVIWSPHPATTPTRQTPDNYTALGFQFKGIEDYPNPGASTGTTADTSFAGGTKQDDTCAKVISAKPPNKDDLTRVYLASKTNPTDGHVFLDLAWARIPQNSTSASAHVGFEFNQGSTACGVGSGGLVQRTVGDMLIVYDFEGGSGPPVLTLRRWLTDPTDPNQEDFFTDENNPCDVDSNSPPCWGDAVNLTAGGFAEGRVNTANVTDALAPPALNSASGESTDRILGTQEFGEAGIDLTAAGVIPAGSCFPAGKAYAVSRSSGQSSQAQMKDLVGPANFNLTNCGTVIIKKHTNPRDLDQEFSFTSNLSGTQISCTQTTAAGVTPVETPTSFSLNDNGTGDTASNTQTCTNVPAGSYTVTEGNDPTGFTFDDLSCTATTGSSGTQNATTEKQADITLASGGTVTCTYVNNQDRQSTLNTAQGFIPQDTAAITGVNMAFDGSVTFKLLKGTLGDTTGETCANAETTDTVVYEQTVANNALGNPNTTPPSRTATTTNPGGDPTTASTTDGYTILDGASEGAYYWKVFYNGTTDPDVTSCNENSTVSINNGSGVSEPPTL
jgi:hypothetical protein